MAIIEISEKDSNINNVLYVKREIGELLKKAECNCCQSEVGGRAVLKIEVPDHYREIVLAEICDKIAEVIVINYKYNYFKKVIFVSGLKETEKEILFTSLIAADLDDDKKYAFDRIKGNSNVAIDGVFNFKLAPLKRKWEDVVSYIPPSFLDTQLKEFITYLIQNKNKKTYIDNGKVYDCHYRKLSRCSLMGEMQDLLITREVLLSNCGFVSLAGSIPPEDEFYLKEFFTDKITFSDGYFY